MSVRSSPRRRSMVVLVVGVLTVMLAACGDDGPNAEDERRLEIAVADPLLDVRPAAAQIDDELDGSRVLAQGDDPDFDGPIVTGAVLGLDAPEPVESVVELYLAALDQGGWQDIDVRCSTAESGLVVLSAKRRADGLTIRSAVDVSTHNGATRVVVRVQAPFLTSTGPDIDGEPPRSDCPDAEPGDT